MAYPKGLEPSTLRVGVSRSIQLSYGYISQTVYIIGGVLANEKRGEVNAIWCARKFVKIDEKSVDKQIGKLYHIKAARSAAREP